jgi:hypothetical protein
MTNYAFSNPVLPGKTETWKRYVQEMKGTRRDEYKKSRQKAGLIQESVWLQHTPQGDVAVVYWETNTNPKSIFEHFMKSDDPFDKWFKEKIMMECHGMKLTDMPPINENILDEIAQKVGEKAYSEAHKR